MLLLTEHTLYSKSVEKILEFSQEYDLLALNSDGTVLRNVCELVFCPCFKEISFKVGNMSADHIFIAHVCNTKFLLNKPNNS